MKKVMFKLESNPKIEKLLNDNSMEVLIRIHNIWDNYEPFDEDDELGEMSFMEFLTYYLKHEDMDINDVDIEFEDFGESLQFNVEEMEIEYIEYVNEKYK